MDTPHASNSFSTRVARPRRKGRAGTPAWLPCALLVCMANVAVAAVAGGHESHPLFESNSALTVTLAAPWRQVVRKARPSHPEAAVLSYADAQGAVHRLDVTVEPRGLSRRRICRFPPIRIRIAPGAARGTLFDGQRSLKLTTHCENGERHAQYTVQEMLAYRIYNLLTPKSFRVRPLDITYEDTAVGKRDGPHLAFVAEDLADVARRNGHAVVRAPGFRKNDYDAQAITRFMLFQYLIGNTDWDVLAGASADECCHNVRVLDGDGANARIPVPYDFDSSGLVDTRYAVPDGKLPIDSVTQRLYRGFCLHNGALEPVRREFLGQRAAILALVHGEPRLGAQRRRAGIAYVEAFYAVLDDDTAFAREITAKCRR